MRRIWFLIFLCWVIPFVSFGQALEGARVRAVDGDSFEILVNGIKRDEVRLNYIDAPELSQPYGPEAKAVLAGLIETGAIRIVPLGIDQFGRKLAEVWLGEQLVNEAMVRAGSAWAFRPNELNTRYQALQATAQAAKLGLWANASPMPPWAYRDAQRGNPASGSVDDRLPRIIGQSRDVAPVSRITGRCEGKRYCIQMQTCAEAQFYYRQCGVSSLDDDGDGRACEDLCRARK
jgi:micrococcal nuclease